MRVCALSNHIVQTANPAPGRPMVVRSALSPFYFVCRQYRDRDTCTEYRSTLSYWISVVATIGYLIFGLLWWIEERRAKQELGSSRERNEGKGAQDDNNALEQPPTE